MERLAMTVPWRSFHHVALVSPDLDATVHFYGTVLEMEAGEIVVRGQQRHCFIKPGPGDAWGLHFLENRDAQVFTASEAMAELVRDPQSAARFGVLPGALQHIAFALPDERAAMALRARLQDHGVAATDIFDFGAIRNFVFADNNGMPLEAAWPKPLAA